MRRRAASAVDSATVGRVTASAACGRLFFLNSVPEVDGATPGELRSAAGDALAALRKVAADPDAQRVERTLRKLVRALPRDADSYLSDGWIERGAAFDNACRQLTGRGAFRD